MNLLFCYCCQGLLNIFPQNNKGKRVMWDHSYYKELSGNSANVKAPIMSCV